MGYRKQKTALITGITGQDGSYLAEHLLERGYYVVGLKRRTSSINTTRIDHLMKNSNFEMRYYSLFDPTNCFRLIKEYEPDEIYNLACNSHVAVSFETPIESIQGILLGTGYWLEAIRTVKPNTKFYQASSSEMFGRNVSVPLNEDSMMLPASPYACGKLGAHHLVQNYREGYGLFACSGILFNHSSPRRGETFLTRKTTIAAARIRLNLQRELVVGNMYSKRDEGYAKDYMEQAHLMLQQKTPKDYVVSMGETHTVKEWIETVFEIAGMPLTWQGEGLEEVGIYDGRTLVKVNKKFFRPQEVPVLLGDSSKAQTELKWKPKVSFRQLAELMYNNDFGLMIEKEGGYIEGAFFD